MQSDQPLERRCPLGLLAYVLATSWAIYLGVRYGGPLLDGVPSPWNGMVQTVAVVVSVAVAGWVLAWWEWRREGERQDAV